MNQHIEDFVKKVRLMEADYCVSYCKARCCKKGKIFLSRKQAEKITRNKVVAYMKMGKLLKRDVCNFELNLEKGCPALSEDNKCRIHISVIRPEICREFPIFIRGEKVFVASFCPITSSKKFLDAVEFLKSKDVELIFQ